MGEDEEAREENAHDVPSPPRACTFEHSTFEGECERIVKRERERGACELSICATCS